MARGGARAGAGRKRGSANVKTRAIAERAAAEGMTPLEVMLHAMRSHFAVGNLDGAASVAKDAAPYIHPRLTAIEHGGKDGGPIKTETRHDLSRLNEDELEQLERIAEKAGAPLH